jgi:hypothetical protein
MSTVENEMQDRVPETAISRDVEERKERKPMYEQNSLTYFKKDPNFRYRSVNDVPGRVERFQAAGWEIVKGNVQDTYSGKGRKEATQQGSAIRSRVNPGQEHQFGIIMRIPINLWEKDQKVKEAKRIEQEKFIDAEGKLNKARILGPRSNIRD